MSQIEKYISLFFIGSDYNSITSVWNYHHCSNSQQNKELTSANIERIKVKKALLTPKASEASWGLSHFFQGVLSGEREVTAIEFAEGGLQKCANAEYLSLYNRCDT